MLNTKIMFLLWTTYLTFMFAEASEYSDYFERRNQQFNVPYPSDSSQDRIIYEKVRFKPPAYQRDRFQPSMYKREPFQPFVNQRDRLALAAYQKERFQQPSAYQREHFQPTAYQTKRQKTSRKSKQCILRSQMFVFLSGKGGDWEYYLSRERKVLTRICEGQI